MNNRRAEVILLCEDKQQSAFFLRLLRAYGIPAGKIRVRPLAAGKQSAEKDVRDKYPIEVSLIRKSAVSRCLVTAIDADTDTVDHHLYELDAALRHAGHEPRHDNEPIVIFIPKRNIETWIRYLLTGEPVSEDQAYAKLSRQ
jgi:hypothetical protein